MSEELVHRAEAIAARAYAPYSDYLVGAVVRANDGTRVRGRQRRERRLPARRLRREERDRAARSPQGYRPGRPRGDRHQRLAVRRLPAVARRVPHPAGELPPRRRARSRRTRPPSSCPTRGSSRRTTREVRLRRRRRPAERRQVDARQRAHRREGGDHLARCRTRRGAGSSASRTATTTSSCSPICPASSGRWTSSPSACSARSTRPSRTSTSSSSCCPRATGSARGDRFIARRVYALGVPVIVALNKVDNLKPSHIITQMKAAAAARRLPRAPSGQREDEGRRRRAAGRSRPPAARGPALLPARGGDRPDRRRAHHRAHPREGAPADARRGAALDLGRARRAGRQAACGRSCSSRRSRRSRSSSASAAR